MVDLVKTTFSTGADESLAAPDIYSLIKNNETVTKITSITEKTAGNVDQAVLGNAKKTASEVGVAAIGIVRNSSAMTTTQVLARAQSASPSLAKAFSSINAGLQDTLKAGLQVDKLPKTIQVLVNGKISQVNFADVNSLTGLKKLFNTLTGKTALTQKDSGSIGTFLSTAASTALDIGVEGTTKDLIEFAANQTVTNALASELSEKLVKKSATTDLYYLSSSASAGVIKSTSPTIIYNFVKSYNKATTLTYAQAQVEYSQLFTSFSNIDAYWNRYIRQTSEEDETCINVTDLVCNNAQFFTLVKYVVVPVATQETPEIAYLAAELLKRSTVETLLEEAYPGVVFDFKQTVSQVTLTTSVA